jgi:putative DNA primase/helicase
MRKARSTGTRFEDCPQLTEVGVEMKEAPPVRASDWLPTVDSREGAWQEPLPLESELPPVEPITEGLLPLSFRPLVSDVAERMQTPADYPAVVAVLCLAGVVNRRAVIQPKANDTSWVVVPNLWGGIIAPPGFMKSPVISATTRPLVQIQAEWRREYEDGLKGFVQEKEEYDLRRSAWKDQFKSSAKSGKAAPERPENPPEEPKSRRLIVNDATFEAMHQTMSENPAGIFVIRDELTGWWSTLDRAGREGERAFCLQAWNGDTGHTIDRIGRGTIHVEACCMSMLGGIQPGRLRSYLADALEDGPSNDGLIQRFQLLVWPDTPADWRSSTESRTQPARRSRHRCFAGWYSSTPTTHCDSVSIPMRNSSLSSGLRISNRSCAAVNCILPWFPTCRNTANSCRRWLCFSN